MDRFIRTEALIGKEGIKSLKKSRIALFGLGGVGGQVLETLIRSSVEKLILVDSDTINETNLNRQIIQKIRISLSPNTLFSFAGLLERYSDKAAGN